MNLLKFFRSLSLTDELLLHHCSRFSKFAQNCKGCIVLLVAIYEGSTGAFVAYLISKSLIAAFVVFILYGALILCFDMLIHISTTKLASIARILFLCFAAWIMHKALMLYVLHDDIEQAIHSMYASKQMAAQKPVTDAAAAHASAKSKLNSELKDHENRLLDLQSKAAQEKGGSLGGSLGRGDVSNIVGEGPRYKAILAEEAAARQHINRIKNRIKDADADYSGKLSIAKSKTAILAPAARPQSSFLNQWAGMEYLVANETDISRQKSYQHISLFLYCLSLLFSLAPVIILNITRTDYAVRSKAMIVNTAATAELENELNKIRIEEIRNPSNESEVVSQDAKERVLVSSNLADELIQDSRTDYGNGPNRK